MDSVAITDIAVHGILLVTGVTGNTFILIVHFLEWLETREHNPCNLIINGISISNILLQISNDFVKITTYIFPEAYLEDWVIYLTTALMTAFSLSSLWCCTCLCFYYCIKIVTLKGAFFHKLKAKLPVIIPWLLVFSVALSWSIGMPAYWDLYLGIVVSILNATENLTSVTYYPYSSRCNCIFQLDLFVIALAFGIIFLTAGTILHSLCKHMSKMKQNAEGSGHSRIRTHLSAAKTVSALLILYLIFSGTFSYLNNPVVYLDSITNTLCVIVISMFPTINAIILIMGNRKLVKALKKILCIKSNAVITEVTVTTFQ